MRRIVIGAVIALIIIGIGAAAYFRANSSQTDPKTTALLGKKSAFLPVDACDILSEVIAKQVLGNDINKVSTNSNAVNSADMIVSTCIYTTKFTPTASSTVPKVSGANVLVRAAKTQTGADSNKTQFLGYNGSDVQKVDGIGDSAFYNKDFMQLNVLKGNNWYTVSFYRDSLSNSTLEGDKALAEKLNFQ
jgi:hypothetical protein